MRFAIVVLVLSALLPAEARSDTVIYLSSPTCLSWLPVAQPFSIAIKARSTIGFKEVEFAVAGLTLAQGIAIFEVTPNPLATTASGNPFAEGAKIAFADCQGTSEGLTLYTATVIAFQNIMPTILVTAHSAPTDPSFHCPTATECSGSTTVRVCAYDAGYTEHVEPPPHSPYPADGATLVPLDVQPYWQGGIDCNCLGLVCYRFWFGQDPEPPLVFSGCDEPFPDLNLQPLTQYYWRVQVWNCGSGTSPVWSFTTGTTVAVHATTWGKIKQIYR